MTKDNIDIDIIEKFILWKYKKDYFNNNSFSLKLKIEEIKLSSEELNRYFNELDMYNLNDSNIFDINYIRSKSIINIRRIINESKFDLSNEKLKRIKDLNEMGIPGLNKLNTSGNYF